VGSTCAVDLDVQPKIDLSFSFFGTLRTWEQVSYSATCDRFSTSRFPTHLLVTDIMLEGIIIRWLTVTPYPNPRHEMPPQYQELHKQQATIGWDQMLYGQWSEH
jgi:hypothetical protein